MIPSQRHLFDIPPDVAYLNCAYMSPLSSRIIEAASRGVEQKARPWKITPEDFFRESEVARTLFAQLINATADDIAIVPAASYGLAVAAHNLPIGADETVLVLAEQFPSNVYTWQELARKCGARVETVTRPEDSDWTSAVLASLDEGVRIAALPHCHWADGGSLNLVAIARRCREIGCALALDITQSIGAMPFDVSIIQPDFVVAGGYKWMMGPYSLGYLYVSPSRQTGQPLEHNWINRAGSHDFSGLVRYQDEYQPGARRFDVGERSNFGLVPASIAALSQLLEWGVPAIAETLSAKTGQIAERMQELDLVPMSPAHRAGHFLGVRFPRGLPEGLSDRLSAENVYVSVRGDSMRITPHLYNDDADEERLVRTLKSALSV